MKGDFDKIKHSYKEKRDKYGDMNLTNILSKIDSELIQAMLDIQEILSYHTHNDNIQRLEDTQQNLDDKKLNVRQ